MKTKIRLFALSLMAAAATYGAPFMAVGDGAELFLTGTLGVRVDDNVYLSDNKVDDVIFDINPGFNLVFGKGSVTQGEFSYTENFSRYSQNSGLDTELSSVRFNSNYDDGKTTFAVNASFNQLNQNTVDVRNANVLQRRDVLAFGLKGESSVSAKSKVGGGLDYNNTNYKRAGNRDLKTVTVPVNYYYAVSEKVDISLGLRYRNSDLKGGNDSKDMAYRLGARGEFSPKVTGSVAVGFGTRDFDNSGSEDMIDLDAKLDIAMTPKSMLQLTASNDFGNSASGQEQKNFSLGSNISSKVSDQLSLRGGVSFRNIDYYTRKDDYVEFQFSTTYVVSQMTNIVGSVAYRKNSSELAGGDFNNTVFSLAANFRY